MPEVAEVISAAAVKFRSNHGNDITLEHIAELERAAGSMQPVSCLEMHSPPPAAVDMFAGGPAAQDSSLGLSASEANQHATLRASQPEENIVTKLGQLICWVKQGFLTREEF